MDRYVRVGDVAGWREGEGRSLPTSRGGVAVFRGPDAWLAVGDTCPHRQSSLGGGWLEGELVVCAMHEWAFVWRTGECRRGGEGVRVRVVRVELRGGEVGVWLAEDEQVEGPARAGAASTPAWLAAGRDRGARAGADADGGAPGGGDDGDADDANDDDY